MRLGLIKAGTPTVGNVVVKIFTVDGAHLPVSQVGVTSSGIDAASLTTTETSYDFAFTPPVAVANAAEYSIVVEVDGTLSSNTSSNCPRVSIRQPSLYGYGQYRWFEAGAWNTIPQFDVVAIITQKAEGGLADGAAAIAGVGGIPTISGVGALVDGAATIAGAGSASGVATDHYTVVSWLALSGNNATSAVGALAGQASVVAGAGVSRSTGAGALADGASTIAGVGTSGEVNLLRTIVSWVALSGSTTGANTGALGGQSAAVTGAAIGKSIGFGVLPYVGTAGTLVDDNGVTNFIDDLGNTEWSMR